MVMAAEASASLLSAVVIGGTGAVGRCLVGVLLKSKGRDSASNSKDSVGKITLLTRRKVTEVAEVYGVDVAAEEAAGRLVQHVEDLEAISDDAVKQLCTGTHVFFNCLGTTRRQAGSAEAFRRIDKEIPLRIARLAHGAGVSHCSTVSSVGANSNSWFLYFKTKGEIDDAMSGIGFSYTSIFRPGLLDRGEANRRFAEKFYMLFQRGILVGNVAQAMLQDALTFHNKADGGGEQQQEGESSATTANVLIADNSRINALCQESVPKETAADES